MKNVNLNEVLAEVELFIDENIDEFEFIVDMNDLHNIEIDFSDNSINITECCSVFVRGEEDKVIEEIYKGCVIKKVIKGSYILYIIC
jgi:hypothetical protein